MPLDPPAPSTPPIDPAPSTLPASEFRSETIWRRTFLAQFANAADREALERFGDLLQTVPLGAGYLGERGRLFAAEELEAVADDLDQVAVTVREISEVPDKCEVGGANLELCGDARDWEGRLSDLAHEIRCRVREVEGGAAPKASPAAEDGDVPLGQDIRDSERIACRMADHHPDPRARRIYRQLVESVEVKRAGGPDPLLSTPSSTRTASSW